MDRLKFDRLRGLLEQHRLDGLLIVEPENFAYFAGVPGFPVTIWRRAGPASAVLNADGEMAFVAPDSGVAALANANPDATIYSHMLWTERVDVDPGRNGTASAAVAAATRGRELVRPETYSLQRSHELVRVAIEKTGLLGGRVGIELDYAPAADAARLQELLDGIELSNSSQLIRDLRTIKSESEIEGHRLATQLAEEGIRGAVAGVDAATTVTDVKTRYGEAIQRAARSRRLLGFAGGGTNVNMGVALFGTRPVELPVQPGEIVQFDCGTAVDGAHSDIGRTFSFGPVNERYREIERALLAGFEAGMERMRPGERFCDVFEATQTAVRAAGFPSYTRGHVGHSIGSTIYGEEWPFFSATETRELETGMVLAFEVPYYINGIGPFQYEDNLVITATGYESFNRLPLEIQEIDAG